MNILEFIRAPLRNAWVDHGPMRVYVRKSRRAPEGAMVRTFDLATIFTPEKLRGQGRFWELLGWLSSTLPKSEFDAIYIESVLEPRFEKSLREQGLQEVPTEPVSFIFWLNKEKP